MLPNFTFGNTIIFIDLSFASTYCIDHNLTNRIVSLGVLSFGLLLLRSSIKYVDDSILHNATVIDPSNEGGDTALREHCILIPPNIIECLSISLMPTIGANIEMSSMTSVLTLRCGSRGHHIVPTPSFDVEPTIGFEIEEPSI